MDEALCRAQPGLAEQVRVYFDRHGERLNLVCNPMQFEGGERTKNSYFHVSEIHSKIEMHHIDRHSYVIAVGGGALLDMAGLASSTAHRGVRHVRIPSTTLSQADSGVGVKNGINAFGKKNFIGAFAPPYAVINDFDLLSSLNDRDKRNGYIEAVKVALIRDREFFEWIEGNAEALAAFSPEPMRQLIHRCAELHINHIATSGDPFEFGPAARFRTLGGPQARATFRIPDPARRSGCGRHRAGRGLRTTNGPSHRRDSGSDFNPARATWIRVVRQRTAAR